MLFQAFKFFMEQHIENVWKERREREQRKEELNLQLDMTFNANKSFQAFSKEDYVKAMAKLESNYLRMKRAKLNKSDFRKIKSIGVGAFGEVSLVERIGYSPPGGQRPRELYAMKTLKKSQVVKRKQVAHVIAEKDILAEANNDWIVKLYYSFQVFNVAQSPVFCHAKNTFCVPGQREFVLCHGVHSWWRSDVQADQGGKVFRGSGKVQKK